MERDTMPPHKVEQLVNGLRDLADWLEERKTDNIIPTYFGISPHSYLSMNLSNEEYGMRYDSDDGSEEVDALENAMQKEWMKSLVRALPGKVEKEHFGNSFQISKRFNEHVEVTFAASRDAVCTKKVVGTESVPERTVPAYEREIVEWECNDSLLAS